MSQGAPIAFDFQVRGDADAKTKIQGVGGALNQLDTSASKASQSATQVDRNYSQAALGLSASVAGATSLYFQFDNLEKVQANVQAQTVAVSRAQDTLQRSTTAADQAQLSFAKAQERLTQLQASGKASAADLAFAQQDLALKSQKLGDAQDKLATDSQNLELATTRLGIATGDVSEAQINFALSILPTVFAGVSGVTGVMKALGLTMDLTRLKTIFTAPPMLTLTGVLGGTTASASGATGALGLLNTVMDFIAANPIILPLTAVAVVLTLVATNAFGVRDALDSFARKVEEIFPILKPVFDFFRNIAAAIFPDTKDKTDDLSQTMDTQFNKMSATVNQSTGKQVTALGDLSSQFVDTNTVASANMTTLASNVKTQSDNIVSAAERARAAMASIGAAPANVTAPASAAPQPPALTQVSPNAAITAGGQIMGLGNYSNGTYIVGSLPSYIQQLGPQVGRDTRSGQLVPIVNVSVQLDGKDIAAKINKNSTTGMLGMT